MSSFIDGVAIPAPLVKRIVSASLVKVGVYDGAHHKFLAKGFQPDLSTYTRITKEAENFGFHEELVKEIVKTVLTDVGTEAVSRLLPSIDITGDQELPVLSHIEFREDNNGITNLIYLGEQKFYVLSTNRSTLMPGNIIKAKTIPLNQGDIWYFDIYEDFESEEPKVPEEYIKYDTCFQTTEVAQITQFSSCEFFKIVDEEAYFGGELQPAPANAFGPLSVLIDWVKHNVDLIQGELPSDKPFPDYITLLTKAKSLGICSYILNILIEKIETRDKIAYSLAELDWHVHKTEAQLKAEKAAIDRHNKERYNDLIDTLNKELQKIHRRRVALFFDAPGIITDESKAHLKPVSEELDKLAEPTNGAKSYGTKGYADSAIRTALDNSKPRPRHNLKVVITLLCIVALVLFVGYSWLTAKKSLTEFNEKTELMYKMLEDERFIESKEFIQTAKEGFAPSYLRFILGSRVRSCDDAIESAIDNFIDSRIEQIQTMIKANRGRIDDYTWDLITEAMELRPENSVLMELREQYIAQ